MLEQRLSELWYGRSALAALLQPLATLYATGLRARRSAYAHGLLHTGRAGVPVVVIGNLTVGGTGKTPLTLWLAERLRERGVVAGILSRGYTRAGSARSPLRVYADSPWREVGDEPKLLARRSGCPTVVARERLAGARELAAHGVPLILADDGLQHLALARDLEILVVDGARGFGNGRLLPAGPLRESPGRLTATALVVVNGEPVHPTFAGAALAGPPRRMRLVGGEAHALRRGAVRPLQAFRGTPVHAVAGIGHPARFFAALREHGLEPIEHAFPDHHDFRPADLAFGDGRPVLMTEKDAMRCEELALEAGALWYVPVTAELSAGDAARLLAPVLALLPGRPAAVPLAAAPR